MDINHEIEEFIKYAKDNGIKIYNEISFQLELGLYFRKHNYEIRFERNINSYDKNTNNYIKKEIDLVLFKKEFNEFDEKCKRIAIELKFPRNGQYPEQMFSFIKDIKFMEQLKTSKKFTETFVVTIVDDNAFYTGNNKKSPYSYFRNKVVKLEGEIKKPTGEGKNIDSITLDKRYTINWENNIEDIIESQKDSPKYYTLTI